MREALVRSQQWRLQVTMANPSTTRIDYLKPKTGTTINLVGGHTLYAAGHVIQVINTYLTAPTSVSITNTYSTFTDIPGLAATITPKSAQSAIYVRCRWTGEFGAADDTWNCMFNLKRNGSLIGTPAQPGSVPIGIHPPTTCYEPNSGTSDANSTPESVFYDYYDLPASTSPVVYQMAICNVGTASTMYINRCVNAATTSGYERGTSSITLMEIAGWPL